MRVHGVWTVLLALIVLSVWTGTGAAQKYGKEWDPFDAVARGQYLTDEEYCKLSQEQAASYCEALQQQLNKKTQDVARVQGELGPAKANADRLRRQLRNLDGKLASMKGEVNRMERQYGPYRNRVFSHTVVKGEYLSMIAEYDRVYGDPMKWPRLYRANKDQIEDPDLIYPDQVLKVPHGYPTWHLVVEGEFLSKIANYWEIYDDGKEWPRIYEANRDQIRDPDMIHPDQRLTIPR